MRIRERLEKLLDEGFDASKDFLDKAKEKTKDMGEKGVRKMEVMRLEHQAEKLFAQLGTKVFEIFVEKKQETISQNTASIKSLMQQLVDIDKKIEDKEKRIADL